MKLLRLDESTMNMTTTRKQPSQMNLNNSEHHSSCLARASMLYFLVRGRIGPLALSLPDHLVLFLHVSRIASTGKSAGMHSRSVTDKLRETTDLTCVLLVFLSGHLLLNRPGKANEHVAAVGYLARPKTASG